MTLGESTPAVCETIKEREMNRDEIVQGLIRIGETGRRTREGQTQTTIADELYPTVANIFDELDRRFGGSEPAAPQD